MSGALNADLATSFNQIQDYEIDTAEHGDGDGWDGPSSGKHKSSGGLDDY